MKKSKNILLVDDDPLAPLLVKKIAEKSGFDGEFYVATDGQKAIAKLENGISGADFPSLIILDLNMPVMTGWEFLMAYDKKLKSEFPNTRVAILSSSIDGEDIERSAHFESVCGFFSKPVTPDSILEMMG